MNDDIAMLSSLLPSYYEEIRLSRKLMTVLHDNKIYLDKEALKAYNKLIAHYNGQMEEGIQ